MGEGQQPDSRTSGSSRWSGRLLALGIGFLLVGLVEMGLHLVPSLTPVPLVSELARRGPERLMTVNPAFPARFFPPDLAGVSPTGLRMTPRAYVEPPAANTVRILFAGESTVQGFPHPRRLAPPAFLEAMLADAWPERRIEVFNAGITAVASFPVLKTVQAAQVLHPDLVVVYAGHNELYGVYGSASVHPGGDTPLAKEVLQFLLQRRLGALVAAAVNRFARRSGPPPTSLLQAMAAAGTIPPDDPRRRRAAENLRANLVAIASYCRSRGIPLVLCTLVCNERSFAPAESPLPATVPPEMVREFSRLLTEAEQLLAVQDGRGVLGVLDRAAAIHADHAGLEFLRGRALEELGEADQARQAYGRARDLDPQPWRAPGTVNPMIRSLAETDGVLVADVEEAFRRVSPAAGVGWELMDDHLHPSVAGEAVLARAVVQALRYAAPAVSVGPEQEARLRRDEDYREALGDLPVEQLAVCYSMAGLLREPPMDHGNQERAARLADQADSLWRTFLPAEKRGVKRWRAGNAPDPLVLGIGDQLFADARFDVARRYYRAASLEEPYTVWADAWATLRWGRCAEMMTGSPNPADRPCLEALSGRLAYLALAPGIDPALIDFLKGYTAHLLGDRAAALEGLRRASADPGIRRTFAFDLLALMAEELAAAGRRGEAEEWVSRVSAETGQGEYGRFLLDHLRRNEPGPAR